MLCKATAGKVGIFKRLLEWGLVLVLALPLGAGGVDSSDMVGQAEGLEPTEVKLAEANEPAETSELAEVNEPAGVISGPEELTVGAKIQSLSFKKDWGIRDALQFLAARYQKNIIPSSKVDGVLTVTNLYDVTFEQALDAILGYGFKYEQQGNFIKVYTADEYKKLKEDPERMTYRVYTLYYISAAEAKKLISPLLSANSKVEVTSAASKDFPTGESISNITGGGDTPAINDMLVVYDYPENLEQVTEVIKAVDVRPKQVLVEATILSVTLTEDTQLGIDWQTLHGAITQLSDITRGSSDFFKSSNSNQVTKTGGLVIGVAHDNIAAFIKAVEEVSDVTVLANPKILAVNKQLGQVYIGKKLGYASTTTTTENFSTEQVGFLDTGTKLSFRPYIGDDGYIRMDIHPKDSSGSLKANNIPDEVSAELVTNIIVRDGQTIVIGGLFRDTVTTNRTQVPVLGDLPLIGGLFRGTADQVKREEVIVLLTPHIVKEPGELAGEDRAADVSRKRAGVRDELQRVGRGWLAEDFYAKAARHYVEGDKKAALQKLMIALRLRPSYLEAIRLKERILKELGPQEAKKIERLLLQRLDEQEAPNWMRR